MLTDEYQVRTCPSLFVHKTDGLLKCESFFNTLPSQLEPVKASVDIEKEICQQPQPESE